MTDKPIGMSVATIILAEAFGVKGMDIPPFQARVRNLRRIGIFPELPDNRGRALSLSRGQLARLAVGMQLTLNGLAPEKAVALVNKHAKAIERVRRAPIVMTAIAEFGVQPIRIVAWVPECIALMKEPTPPRVPCVPPNTVVGAVVPAAFEDPFADTEYLAPYRQYGALA